MNDLLSKAQEDKKFNILTHQLFSVRFSSSSDRHDTRMFTSKNMQNKWGRWVADAGLFNNLTLQLGFLPLSAIEMGSDTSDLAIASILYMWLGISLGRRRKPLPSQT